MQKAKLPTIQEMGSPRARSRPAPCLLAAIGSLAPVGCGSKQGFQFDKLDLSLEHDELSEFSLGHYEIPIPLANDRTNDHATWSNRIEFNFDLYALVGPADESGMADNWERHEGKIRDRVIQVCRTASLDELQEPELATLKARLMDAVQEQLGEREVRRLLMTEVVSQRL